MAAFNGFWHTFGHFWVVWAATQHARFAEQVVKCSYGKCPFAKKVVKCSSDEPRVAILEPRMAILEPGAAILEPSVAILEPRVAILERFRSNPPFGGYFLERF